MEHRMDPISAAQLQNLGAVLRRARLRGGWTQEAFAERCDLSVNYISNLEHGKQEPGLQVLAKLSAGLATRPSAILRRAGL